MKLLNILFCLLLLILWTSCKVSTPAEEKRNLYQVGGCQGNAFLKPNVVDTCFIYQFRENLILDFCVYGNCCPDSNRFDLRSNLTDDLITITVTDTAANLCRCFCKYKIHAEFDGLSQSRYRVKCYLGDKLLYDQSVEGED